MSIEGSVLIHETGQTIRLGSIGPGQHVGMISHPEDQKEIISIGCRFDDLGGTIHRFAVEEAVDHDALDIPATIYDSSHEVACIPPYGQFEVELTHESGLAATLTLQHFIGRIALN